MENISKNCYVFQTDSEIVKQVYENRNNYLIEHTESGEKSICAVYFSSNDIYYPNTKEIFTKRIDEKNFFEWYHTRIDRAYKHIFIRDVFKQWYLAGISQKINSPEKLVEFLRNETKGFDTITIGSSAGGYAAILYGSLINAKTAIAFNPQFEIASLLKRSSEQTDPLVFRLKDTRKQYYDIVPFLNNRTEVFYFFSSESQWDIEQNKHISPVSGLHKIQFKSRHHGIPFLKAALPKVLNAKIEYLRNLEKEPHNPIFFTIRLIGFRKTINGLISQLYQVYRKRR